ncbi:MAG: VirB8/TrbF family protein [Bacteroidota bacterium]|nr:VirB8/TrbF family protein [Bacteroidota bacterium]MDE2956225.1 VirB8/TrbF family protein [Bacteroidota bacterium]
MKRKPPSDPPYLSARYAFERLFGDLARGRRSWQAFALAMLLANLVLTIGFVYVAAQRKVVPYVVELDALGEMRTVGLLGTQEVPERAIMAVLRQFVHNMRTVPTDARLLNIRLQEAKAHARGRAAEMLIRELTQEREQLELMLQRGDTRYVEEISTILKVPGQGQLYRVAWRELTRTGTEVMEEAVEGHFQLRIELTEEEAAWRANPLGIYVTDFTWTRVGRQ